MPSKNKTMLNLNPKYADMIKKILQQHIPNATVWAYGSRVKNQSHEGSDLDLVIRYGDVSPQQLSTVREAFSDSNIPILIDLLDWKNIPEPFQVEIEKKHELFFGKK